jgi:G3E family GTPase
VSIDHLTLASEGDKELQVMEVEGGCICCSAAQNMHFSLQMMLTRLRPNRILIEPTGMGHPASILDLLRSRAFSNDIYVDTTICILNPAQLSRERYQTDGTYLDQISLADVLVANKTICVQRRNLSFFGNMPKSYIHLN